MALSTDENQGIILYDGQRICGGGWNHRSAQVLCRQLHPNSRLIAAIDRSSVIGDTSSSGNNNNNDNGKNNNNNYLNVKFDCRGIEKNLSECEYRASSKPCESDSPALAKCLSPLLELRDEYEDEMHTMRGEGKLFMDGIQVCGDGWTDEVSHAICKEKFGPESRACRTENVTKSESVALRLRCG